MKPFRFSALSLLGLLSLFSLFSCASPDAPELTPCDYITVEYHDYTTADGRPERMATLDISSTSPSITYCRTFPDREQCWVVQSHYFNCVSFHTRPAGEVITVTDAGETCHLIIN